MTKSKMVEFFKRFDDEKFHTYEHGTDFVFVIHDQEHNQFIHTGIGTGDSTSMMLLYSAISLYRAGQQDPKAKRVSIEDYAESVKQGIIKAWTENVFDLEDIHTFDGDKG